jgi:hypothetical protein
LTWKSKKVGGDAMRDTNRDNAISYEFWLYYTSGTVYASIIFDVCMLKLWVIPVSKNWCALALAASCTVAQLLGSTNALLNMENGIIPSLNQNVA